MNLRCSICGKVVKERKKNGVNRYPVSHEGMVKGQPCHGFYIPAHKTRSEVNE